MVPLDWLKPAVGVRWKVNGDRVAGADLAAGDHDAHDAGFANEIAALVLVERRRHEAGLDLVELRAGIPQTGHLDSVVGLVWRSVVLWMLLLALLTLANLVG